MQLLREESRPKTFIPWFIISYGKFFFFNGTHDSER